MAIASLVLGIVAIVFGFIGLGIPIGAVCGLVGIIMGALGRRNPNKAGMATAGLVCSIIGLIISVLGLILCASCLGSAGLLGSSLF